MEYLQKYEPVIGLEIHIQLKTESKMYASDSAAYGGSPNTQVSVITLGHPGTLPRINSRALESAVKLGLAVGSEIRKENLFARKNYFYADLPKGYQITQDKTPICNGGSIALKLKNGISKTIRLTRIHLEEDAGKAIHDMDPENSLIDLNRAGVPLLEIVSEPEFTNGEEAYAYLAYVRKLVRYLDICDGNMEEGSMRCDANISVRKKGEKAFGKRVEVKNMNSIRNVQRAIDYEYKRQSEIIEKGGSITVETRSFDASNDSTFSLRLKEEANDYRYFPEPDLQPVMITEMYIQSVAEKLPQLPDTLFALYVSKFHLSEYDAQIITESRDTAEYFNALVKLTTNYKSAANWLMVNIKGYLNEHALTIERFSVQPNGIAGIIALIDNGSVSHSVAAQKIFPKLVENPTESPLAIASRLNLLQENDAPSLKKWVDEVVEKFPEKVAEYKSGKTGLLGMFMGEVMKLSKGKADPKIASKMVKEKLDAH